MTLVKVFLDWARDLGCNPPMQTLGISNSEPRTDNRLKSLFWPTIQTGTDADDLGMQGYWICAIVAILSFVVSILTGHPIAGFLVLVFYYIGGVGVREHSLYAALLVFLMFVLDTVAVPSIPKAFICVVLLSNLRATWLASRWKPGSSEAEMPIRLGATWGDKFADKLPEWLWPKVKLVYFVFAPAFLALVLIGLGRMLTHAPAHYPRHF
jgi:hypothetical protein